MLMRGIRQKSRLIRRGERLVSTESPFVRIVFPEPYVDSLLFGGQLRYPLVQKAALNIPAGEIVNFSTARRFPLGLWVTVITGVCDVYIDPALPGSDPPDLRFAKDVKPAYFRTAPGAYKFYIRAGDGRPLQASLVFVDIK
jgi:hypothetical protein